MSAIPHRLTVFAFAGIGILFAALGLISLFGADLDGGWVENWTDGLPSIASGEWVDNRSGAGTLALALAYVGFGLLFTTSALTNLGPEKPGQLLLHGIPALLFTLSLDRSGNPIWVAGALLVLGLITGGVAVRLATIEGRRTPTASLRDFYQNAVSSRRIRADAGQQALVETLDRLGTDFQQFQNQRRRPWGFVARPPIGVYLHGPAGRGKSFLLDGLFQTLPANAKRRYHYFEMMSQLLDELHQQAGSKRAIRGAARRLANPGDLIFIDELNVLDLTGARILIPLLDAWWRQKSILCISSNLAPTELFAKVALEVDQVESTAARLTAHCQAIELKGSEDYRANKLSGADLYQSPITSTTNDRLTQILERLAESEISHEAVALGGQQVASRGHASGIGWFEFDELCLRPLGYRQYLDLVEQFPTLILSEVPLLTQEDPARRFAWLVESIYDAKQRLVVSAQVPIAELFAPNLSSTGAAADFGKITSRLMEMQSSEYNYVLSTDTAAKP